MEVRREPSWLEVPPPRRLCNCHRVRSQIYALDRTKLGRTRFPCVLLLSQISFIFRLMNAERRRKHIFRGHLVRSVAHSKAGSRRRGGGRRGSREGHTEARGICPHLPPPPSSRITLSFGSNALPFLSRHELCPPLLVRGVFLLLSPLLFLRPPLLLTSSIVFEVIPLPPYSPSLPPSHQRVFATGKLPARVWRARLGNRGAGARIARVYPLPPSPPVVCCAGRCSAEKCLVLRIRPTTVNQSRG